MSELPPVPPRDKFTGSPGDRYVMDYLRVMSSLGESLVGHKQIAAFVAAGWKREDVHYLLNIMTRIASRSLANDLHAVPSPPRPSREALMRAEVARRSNKMKGKYKFTVIKGDKV